MDSSLSSGVQRAPGAATFASAAGAQGIPKALEPVPSERQLRWHEMEMTAFLHFGMNTFTDKEWGYGDESPQSFHPTALDADQIVRTLKDAGFKGVILTAKHHDGFCLWPSEYTEHSVKNSPWKRGKGDVVREIADACHSQEVQFGVYLSPWDRNHAEYGRPAYIEYYLKQLRELLTQYGPVFEFWMDNANGGDGFYGGACETRQIDRSTYYPWETIWSTIRELQPQTIIWGEIAPGCDVRWIGNEDGVAGDPCWATENPKMWISHSDLNTGIREGSIWIPGETNTSIRPGWFYHPHQDDQIKSPARLMQYYFESVGRSTNMLLNIPPDPRGVINEHDVKVLRDWHGILEATFATDFARGATASASNVRSLDARFAAANVIDGNRDTYWASDDSEITPKLVLNFPQPITFNVVRLREFLPLGQRVDSFALDYSNGGEWEQFASAKQIGAQRILPTRFITTDRVRLRITRAMACPAISELGLFAMPAGLDVPRISRDRNGRVSLSTDFAGPWIRYTLDGTEPGANSPVFEEPFPFLRGGTVRARVALRGDGRQSLTISKRFGPAKGGWKVRASYADQATPAEHLIDENPNSIWSTSTSDLSQGAPQEVVLDLAEATTLKGFTLLPRQDGQTMGTPDRYTIYVSLEDGKWGDPVAAGEFSNIRASNEEQTILFAQAVVGRYVRFIATHVLDDEKQVVVAEIGVVVE